MNIPRDFRIYVNLKVNTITLMSPDLFKALERGVLVFL